MILLFRQHSVSLIVGYSQIYQFLYKFTNNAKYSISIFSFHKQNTYTAFGILFNLILFYASFTLQLSLICGIVRENGALNSTVSVLRGIVKRYAPLLPYPLSSPSSYMPFGVSSRFLRDPPPVFLILCFRRSTDVSPYLCYRPFFYRKSFLSFSLLGQPSDLVAQ